LPSGLPFKPVAEIKQLIQTITTAQILITEAAAQKQAVLANYL
jgi:hypothetical protein